MKSPCVFFSAVFLALSSPAMFSITRHAGHDAEHLLPGVHPVHGDGCFNAALNRLVNTLNTTRSSTAGVLQ